MATIPVTRTSDGYRTTVNDMLKSPTRIPARILSLMDQQFIMESVLRNAGAVPSGALIYEETAPQFADEDPLITEEAGEIPILGVSVGKKLVARTTKRTGGMIVTREERSRNAVDPVQRKMRLIRNTFVRAFEDLFLNLFLTHPGVQTYAGNDWGLAATRPRDDLAEAIKLVQDAAPDDAPDDFLGYDPNLLIISTRASTDFLKSDDVAKVFIGGNIASLNPQYKGTMPNQFYGLTVLKSRQMPVDKAILLEAKTVGGYADEYPLEATPMYEIRQRQLHRSDITRSSTAFLDNPKAAVILNGIGTAV